jgi:hypothetical protein
MKKLLIILAALLPNVAAAGIDTPEPPLVAGGLTRQFEQWSHIADKGETMTFQVETEVRLLGYGPARYRTFQPGETAVCSDVAFGGWANASWQWHTCSRLVQRLILQEHQPQTTDHPWVDQRLAILPPRGFSTQRIQATTEQPVPTANAAFRIGCSTATHTSFDDPIVYPGQPNKAHYHIFFGNISVNAFTVYPGEKGNGACTGGTVNRSGYWVPAVIDTRFGRTIAPLSNVVYYKAPSYINPALIQVPPAGLRMVSGNHAASGPPPGGIYADWKHRIDCMWIVPGSIPAPLKNTFGAKCAVGDRLEIIQSFPFCWDGVNLDSPDHKSHMAYGTPYCPATHPVVLPSISFNIQYPVEAGDDTSKWRLSSDHYDWTIPGGYSQHGDWMNGWDQTILRQIVEQCLNASKDCHAHLIGNNQMIY